MIKTYKYRLKDRRARKLLTQHAFQCNQIWNWCVAQHRDTLDRYWAGAPKRKWLSYFDLQATFNGYGREIGLSQRTIAAVCQQWHRSRSRTFRASYGSKRALGWVPFLDNRKVNGTALTFMGKVYRFFGSKRRPIPETAKGGCFVEDALGRWWVCFHAEVDETSTASAGEIGIDLGIKDFAALSDGQKFPPPKSFREIEPRLAVAQRSGNKRRAAALHLRAANIRRDFHHKLSRQLANDYAFIAVGNVSSKGLAKTRMAKSVLDAGWSAFRTMLAYKAAEFVEVDERFTTQTCSSCGSLPPERPKGIAGLGMRAWDCSDCGASHDRDVNAARNILRLGRSVAPLVEESRKARIGTKPAPLVIQMEGK